MGKFFHERGGSKPPPSDTKNADRAKTVQRPCKWRIKGKSHEESYDSSWDFGALEGTRIPGPLIKRIQGASFVKFQKFEETLFYRIIAKHAFAHTALFAYSVMLCNRYPAIRVCKKCAKMCRRAKQSPMDKSTTGFMAGFRTSEQTPFDIEMRFTMNKLLTCRY